MSFSPLPDLFLDHFESCLQNSGRVLDLGCGDGEFFALMDHQGVEMVGLDRMGRAAGTVADVVGDVHQPPLQPGSFDMVVAANLFRHIISDDPKAAFLGRWMELLKPGGALFIFEDEPSSRPGPEKNYKDFQDFLFRLMPAGRGPLVPLAEFKVMAGLANAETRWVSGMDRNEMSPNSDLVLEMLSGDGGKPVGEPVNLAEAIKRDGLAYGNFWWARWQG